jgi:Uma2 family endonuclease
MKSSTLVSVEEYLATPYRPDCEYVEGEVRERNLGEQDHSRVQIAIGSFLFVRRRKYGISVFTEQRVQVKPSRFRVPDVCVVIDARPDEQIFRRPPFLCIEILSPGDTNYSMQERIDDYLAFGVPYVWMLNPASRRGWVYTKDAIEEAKDGVLRTSNPNIEVPIAELFDKDED